jgi:hypothetical protein
LIWVQTRRYRSTEGVIVAPALETASAVTVPCECISGSFAKAITTHPIVPISAVIAVIAAGRNLSGRLFLFLTGDIPRSDVFEVFLRSSAFPLEALAPDGCAERHTVGLGEIERKATVWLNQLAEPTVRARATMTGNGNPF